MSTATGELQTQVSLGRVCRLRVRIKGGTQIRWRGDAASGAAQPVYPQASLPTLLPPTSRSRVWLRWQGLPERVSDASEELRSSNVAVTVDVVSAQIKQGMQVQPLLRLPEPPASSLTRSLPPSLSLSRPDVMLREIPAAHVPPAARVQSLEDEQPDTNAERGSFAVGGRLAPSRHRFSCANSFVQILSTPSLDPVSRSRHANASSPRTPSRGRTSPSVLEKATCASPS